MWLLIRVSLALVALIVRYKNWGRARGTPCEITPMSPSGRPLLQAIAKRKGTVTRVSLITPLKGSVGVVFKRETSFDQFLKNYGFATEFQTHDPLFDGAIYIAGDHPSLISLLRSNPSLRDAVFKTVANTGVKSGAKITWDGSHLTITSTSVTEIPRAWIEAIDVIANELSQLPKALDIFRADPFFKRVLLMESAAWALAGYGLGAFIGFALKHSDTYLDPTPPFRMGLTLGFGFAFIFGISSLWFLRGSSRGPQLLADVALTILVSGVIAGPQLICDINETLDFSRQTPVVTRVVSKDVVQSGGRRRNTRYYLGVESQMVNLKYRTTVIPNRIEVERSFFEEVEQTRQIEITVREGAFGFPWIQKRKVLPISFPR